MERMLINAIQPDEVRVAVTQNRQLSDLDIEQTACKRKKANIYKGVITSIEPSLGAVFVNYGAERHGFLPVKEISKEYFSREHLDKQKNHDISSMDPHKLLTLGQQLVVQIEKEERGNKGAALSTFISLAGSFLVLMPNSPRAGGISRRIEGEDRDQLKETVKDIETPEGMSVIIRTACVGKTTEELNWDLQVLLRYWEAIKQAAIVKPGPYLIHQESDIIIRSIRDYLRHDIQEIIIDEESAYKRALTYLEQIRPEFISRLKLYTDTLPIFSRFQIEQQIENAYQREVQLPSGGSIVIDHTEALVAIDVNSARATRGSSIEETAYNTNLEAVEEIAKQLRIRDIGGLVAIDLIDMLKASHQRNVENRLRESLRYDRARIQIGRISRFGILEMSRQRLRSPLIKNTQDSCPRCYGRGLIRSVESLTTSILHLIEEQAVKAGSAQLQVQLPIDITTYLLNEKRSLLIDIQTRNNADIVIIPNHHLESPAYQIKLIKDDHGKSTASYKQVKVPKAEPNNRKTTKLEDLSQPAINEFLTTQTPNFVPRKANSEGFLKKLWEVMFGDHEEAPTPVKAKRKEAPTKARAPSYQKTDQDKKETPRSNNKKPSTRRGNRAGQQQKNTSKLTEDSPPTQKAKRQPNKPGSNQNKKTPAKQPQKSYAQKNDTATQPKRPEKATNLQQEKVTQPKQPEKTTNLQQEKVTQPKQPEKTTNLQQEKVTQPKQPEKTTNLQQEKVTQPKQPEKTTNLQQEKVTQPKQPEKTTNLQQEKVTQPKQPEVTHNIEQAPELVATETTVFDHTKPEKQVSKAAAATIPEYKKPDLPAYQGLSSVATGVSLQQVTTKKKTQSAKEVVKDKDLISTEMTDKKSDE